MCAFKDYDNLPEEIENAIVAEKQRREEEAKREEEARKQAETRKREETLRKAEERRKRDASLRSEKDNLLNELSNLKGLFSGKRKKEIQERLDMIERELNR